MSPMRMTDLYPHDWPAIAYAVKAANDWRCQECGKQCTRPGEAYSGASNVLTVAHAGTDYTTEAVTVWALCAPCHLRYDAQFSHVFRRRYERERQRQAGQMALLPPVRYE
jgi:hypothetical protein